MTYPNLIAPEVDGISTAHLTLQATWGDVGRMTLEEFKLWKRARDLAYDNQPHWVYWHLDAAGQVLYIGCTNQPTSRQNAHRSSSSWWPDVARIIYTEFATMTAALAAERQAIRAQRPLYNIVNNPDWAAARVRRNERAVA